MGKKEKKSKHKKKRYSSSSSGSSTDDELTKLELEKIKLLQEKINAKKKVKECESMVEKRARRLRKKAEKERKRQELIGFDKSALGNWSETYKFGSFFQLKLTSNRFIELLRMLHHILWPEYKAIQMRTTLLAMKNFWIHLCGAKKWIEMEKLIWQKLSKNG